MKKISTLIILGMLFCSLGAFAQLTIGSGGNVGIDAPGALSRFSIGSAGAANSKVYINGNNTSSSQNGLVVKQALTNSGYTYAANSYVDNGTSSAKAVGSRGSAYKTTPNTTGMSFGTLGIAGNGQAGYNYAVWGQLLGSNNGAAIFGTVPGKSETVVNGMYAGYFRGNVHMEDNLYVEDNLGVGTTTPAYKLEVNGDINALGVVMSKGVILTSDSTKKTDIQALGNGNLSRLNSLKVVTFKYEQPEIIAQRQVMGMAQDTGKVEVSLPVAIPNAELYEQTQIGLLAQDLQQVYPDLVVADKEGILGINYTGLVAVLVAAMKEQQAEIEALKQKIGK